ncbi:hypothetical protein Droror1_Dr00012444 [Drosera rotundifolia]
MVVMMVVRWCLTDSGVDFDSTTRTRTMRRGSRNCFSLSKDNGGASGKVMVVLWWLRGGCRCDGDGVVGRKKGCNASSLSAALPSQPLLSQQPKIATPLSSSPLSAHARRAAVVVSNVVESLSISYFCNKSTLGSLLEGEGRRFDDQDGIFLDDLLLGLGDL